MPGHAKKNIPSPGGTKEKYVYSKCSAVPPGLGKNIKFCPGSKLPGYYLTSLRDFYSLSKYVSLFPIISNETEHLTGDIIAGAYRIGPEPPHDGRMKYTSRQKQLNPSFKTLTKRPLRITATGFSGGLSPKLSGSHI
jgi:hypothetical protein